MNEFLRQFIMTGIRDMIDRGIALYQTYQYASGWFDKGVLTQEDLEEIQRLYQEKENPVLDEPTVNEQIEETLDEVAEEIVEEVVENTEDNVEV